MKCLKPIDVDDLKRFAAEMHCVFDPVTERVERLDFEDLLDVEDEKDTLSRHDHHRSF